MASNWTIFLSFARVCVQVEVVKGRVKKLAANIAGYG